MNDLGQTLLQLARHSISQALGQRSEAPDTTANQAALAQPGATFVTLTQHGELRGCIGSLEAWRPLEQDVQANAIAAALRDSRFAPLTASELPYTRIEVSLVSAAEPLNFANEAEALSRLQPGIDGVILQANGRRATFLPQVWEQLPDPAVFMAQLKRKAGLPADYWSDAIQLSRYSVHQWYEADSNVNDTSRQQQ